jgi:hypothetical protein
MGRAFLVRRTSAFAGDFAHLFGGHAGEASLGSPLQLRFLELGLFCILRTLLSGVVLHHGHTGGEKKIEAFAVTACPVALLPSTGDFSALPRRILSSLASG